MVSIEREADKNRILQFDLMRSLAIFIILIYHLPGYSYNFFSLGFIGIKTDPAVLREFTRYFGLGLFIFLSGYLANLKQRSFADSSEIKKFIKRKLLRIVPPYYLALIMFCYVYEISEPLNIAAHFLGLQLILASQFIRPAPTLWFIGLILVYYATYIFAKAEKFNDKVKLVVLVLLPIAIFALNTALNVMDLRIVLYYGIFVLGLYSGKRDIYKSINSFHMVVATLVFIVIMLIHNDYTFLTNPFYTLGSFVIVNVFMFIITGLTYKGCMHFSKNIKHKHIKWVEVISYSSFCMFLFHRLVWSIMVDILDVAPITLNEHAVALILATIGIPIIIFLSYSVQRLYDRVMYAL